MRRRLAIGGDADIESGGDRGPCDQRLNKPRTQSMHAQPHRLRLLRTDPAHICRHWRVAKRVAQVVPLRIASGAAPGPSVYGTLGAYTQATNEAVKQ
jgi:hypothetical protein